MDWHEVCNISDVSQENPKHVDVKGKKVGIYQIDESYFALEDICPHAYAFLTQGFIEDDTIECPLHEAIFNIRTGNLIKGPECRNLIRYPVKIEGSGILIQIGADE